MKSASKIMVALVLSLSVLYGITGLAVQHLAIQQAVQGSTRLGDIGRPIYTGIPSNTGVLCGTASTQLVSTSTSRQYLEIRNQSSQTVWLSFGVPASTSTGVALVASSSPMIISPYTFMYSGAIYCIAASNASTTALEAK